MSATDCSFLLFLLCACLLAGCQSSSEEKSLDRAREILARSGTRTHGDWATGKFVDIPESGKLTPAASITNMLRNGKQDMDLRFLGFLETRPTRKDFEPFRTEPGSEHVQTLNLSDDNLTDDELAPINGLHLMKINLTNNRVRSLNFLAGMDSLIHVDVKATDVDGSGIKVLSKLTNVCVVNLSHTHISDRDLPELCRMKHLTRIEISGCPEVTEAGLARLRAAMPHTIVYSGQK